VTANAESAPVAVSNWRARHLDRRLPTMQASSRDVIGIYRRRRPKGFPAAAEFVRRYQARMFGLALTVVGVRAARDQQPIHSRLPVQRGSDQRAP
jgi:hypothetical protein